MRNLIAFKKNLVTFKINDSVQSELNNKVSDLQNLLMEHGYMFTEKAFNNLRKSSQSYLNELEMTVKDYFKDIIGKNDARELFELFEDEVDNVYTSFESFIQLIWSGSQNSDVPQIYETTDFTFIDYATEVEFKKIFTDLVQINNGLTESDFKVVEWFAKEYGNDNIMPQSIPFKENLCMVASLGLDVPVKTSTDVLRIATYMSNGTTDLFLPPKFIKKNAWTSELVENTKRKEFHFNKFKRKERKYLLSLLNKVANSKEMVLYRNRWIKLGEILHPGDYSNKYPFAYKSFNELRNSKIKSWYSDLDKAFLKSIQDGLDKLSERPGEFARKLDHLLRYYFQDQTLILNSFKKIGSKISKKVLWELYSHFGQRTEEIERKIWIKNSRTPVVLPTLKTMDEKLVDDIHNIIKEIITDSFSNLEKMGNVYIDKELKKIPVPTNMKTLQEAKKVVIRGTRMPLITNKKVLRPYIHWTAGVDLDLSINFIDKDGNGVVCSYQSVSPHKSIRHSGDVIPKVKGKWAEYIDIDLKNNPYKYGLVTVRNFEGSSLENVNAIIGFMERDNIKSSTKWYPKTVTNSFKVSSTGQNINLLIIDFETMEWILVDEDVAGVPIEYRKNILKYIEQLSIEPKLSVYDILDMHVSVRGNKITEITEDNTDEIDKMFTFDEFSTSYEKIAYYML